MLTEKRTEKMGNSEDGMKDENDMKRMTEMRIPVMGKILF